MRKVLSFVLVLSLVLGSFSMAFAATPVSTGLSDINGIANAEAIQVNYDLGIVTGNPDGTFLPEKTVNRAEFAAMITRALAIPDSALAGYTTTSFKDTVGYGWAVPYLAFCNSKGIMLGDGNGNAMPGRTINTNEAVTMVLRAIGYTSNSSDLVGVWPANYVTKAQDLGIYKDVAAAVSVDKANAAQMIYNGLTIVKVQVATDGTTTPVTGAPTMLTAGLDCTPLPDTTIDGTEDSIININQYLGIKGDAYLNDSNKIVAFKAESTQIVGKMAADGKMFTATIDDTEYTTTGAIDLANTAHVPVGIVNGEYKAAGVGATAAGIEYVINAELSGKKISKIYSVLEWTVTSGDVVDAGDIADITSDKSLLSHKFKLDDDDNIDLTTFSLIGVPSLDKIAKDNVVYVYAGANNKITRVEVGTDVVEGVIANFKTGSGKFTIGAKTYKNATAMVNGVAANTAADTVVAGDVSDEIKANLDAHGYVFAVEDISGGATNIAVIEKQAAGINDQVKIFKADGTSSTHTYDAAEISLSVGNVSMGAVIGYGLNKDGKITSSNQNLTPSNTAIVVKSDNVVRVAGTDRSVASDVVVFTYDTVKGEFALSSMAKLEKNTASTASVLYKDATATAKIIGIVVPKGLATASSDDTYAVVNDLYTDVADGDKVDRIVGFADGKAIDKMANDLYFKGTNAVVATAVGTGPAVLTVQLFKIEMDSNGIIINASLVDTVIADKTTKEAVAELTGADGRKSVSFLSPTAITAPLSDKVVVYEVNDDGDYVVYTGGFKAHDLVVMYELDDDQVGYDVVFLSREYR